jgi:hypothetical protein
MLIVCKAIAPSFATYCDRPRWMQEMVGLCAAAERGGSFHPANENNSREFYLMCDDLEATMQELEARGACCGEPSERSWGIVT